MKEKHSRKKLPNLRNIAQKVAYNEAEYIHSFIRKSLNAAVTAESNPAITDKYAKSDCLSVAASVKSQHNT